MTTLLREMRRCFHISLISLTITSVGMGVLQWLVFSRGGGAQNWIYRFASTGHPRLSKSLEALNELSALRRIDYIWQTVINSPRNHLYSAIGLINSPDSIYFYGSSGRVGWWCDVRDCLVFALGTVAVYVPVLVLAAWIQARMRTSSFMSSRGSAGA